MTGALSWDDLVTAAILGTDRRHVDVGTLGGPAGEAAGRLAGDPATTLLGATSLFLAWERGGALALGNVAAPTPLPPEELRPMGPPAERAFLDALQAQDLDVLPEALALAAAAGLAAPPRCLPALLDRAVTSTALRPAVLAVLGERGRWLAAQNPAWAALGDADAADVEARLLFAPQGAGQDGAVPDGAVPDGAGQDGAADRWAALPGPRRLATLRSLRASVGPGDEALLERALDDRRGDVRTEAATLLAALPGSAYVGRMTARADHLVAVVRGPLGAQVSLVELDRLDDAAARDGLPDQYRLAGSAHQPGARRAQAEAWAAAVLTLTPLRVWDLRLGGPEAALAAVAPQDVPVFWAAWARAAAGQNNPSWMPALASILSVDDLSTLADDAPIPWPEQFGRAVLTRLRAVLARVADATGQPDAVARATAPRPAPTGGPVREASLVALVRSISAGAAPTDELVEAMLALASPASPADPADPAAQGAADPTAQLGLRLERSLHEAHDLLALRRRLNREIS